MNKLHKIVLSLSFVTGSLYAHVNTKNSNNHTDNQIYNGVMTNHINPNSMTNK